jgi:hypothetical protein
MSILLRFRSLSTIAVKGSALYKNFPDVIGSALKTLSYLQLYIYRFTSTASHLPDDLIAIYLDGLIAASLPLQNLAVLTSAIIR